MFGIEIYFTDFTDAWSSLTVEDKTILAMVSDDEIKGLQIPRFNMNETQKIADFIISMLGLFSTDVRSS